MDLQHRFKEELSKYLSRSANPGDNLVKFETQNLFDFSFIINLKVWSNYFHNIEETDQFSDNILLYADNSTDEIKSIEKLKHESEKFIFTIEELEVKNFKCFVKVMRNTALKTIFETIASGDFGNVPKNGETMSVNICEIENSSITNFRLETLALVLRNLINYSKYTLPADDSCAEHQVLLTTRSNVRKDECFDSNIRVLCSVVCDKHDNNKKISHQSADEYIQKRMDEMHLMALHKYGVRVKSDDNFVVLREKLGEAACKLDMIEVKHCNALILMHDPKQAFILYNSARIETLLKSFNEKVASGYYPELPQLENVDLNLLADDEEWGLLKQLMLFPEVIQNSIGDLKNGRIGIHLLYKYLHRIAIVFSNYYCKKKVLTENRPQLIPILHAKIHFLKAVQTIFNKLFYICGIQPVSFM